MHTYTFLTFLIFNSDDDSETLREIQKVTNGHGCEVSIDCSGAPSARRLALRGTRRWGRCVFVGEGNTLTFDVSQELIHQQITIYGSWVTSLKHLEDLVENLDRWQVHPELTCTHRFTLKVKENVTLFVAHVCVSVCLCACSCVCTHIMQVFACLCACACLCALVCLCACDNIVCAYLCACAF